MSLKYDLKFFIINFHHKKAHYLFVKSYKENYPVKTYNKNSDIRFTKCQSHERISRWHDTLFPYDMPHDSFQGTLPVYFHSWSSCRTEIPNGYAPSVTITEERAR